MYVCMLFGFHDCNGIIRPGWESCFETAPEEFPESEKAAFLSKLSGVALSSDAFFPFRFVSLNCQYSSVNIQMSVCVHVNETAILLTMHRKSAYHSSLKPVVV